MKLFFILFVLVVTSCSGTTSKAQPTSQINQSDIFDRLSSIMKNPSISNLKNYLGEPSKIIEKNKTRFIYESKNDHPKLEIILNKELQKVEKIALFFWENNDNYAFLKNRFNEFEWKETKIKTKLADNEEERILVNIPKLGISFEYDNASPQRKVMWIFFEISADK